MGSCKNVQISENDINVKLGGIEIFSSGSFRLDPATEVKLSDYLMDCQLYPPTIPEDERTYPSHFKTVDIDISLGSSFDACCSVYGSDLTTEYVEVNADYRS